MAKEKELLVAKEAEILKEIEMVEKNVMAQERDFRETQRAMEDALQDKLGDHTGDRKELVRKRHMEMSKERGSQAAGLELRRKLLQEDKLKVELQLAKIRPNATTRNVHGTISNEDSLSEMVKAIDLEATSSKLEHMKEESKKASEEEAAFLRTIDLEYDTVFTTSVEDEEKGDELTDFIEDWIKEDVDTSETKNDDRTKRVLEELDRFESPSKKSIKPSVQTPPPVKEKKKKEEVADALDKAIQEQEDKKEKEETLPAQTPFIPYNPNEDSNFQGQYNEYDNGQYNSQYGYDPYSQGQYYAQSQQQNFQNPYGNFNNYQNSSPYGYAGNYGMGSAQTNPYQQYDPNAAAMMQQEMENTRMRQELDAIIDKKESEESRGDRDRMDLLMGKLNVRIFILCKLLDNMIWILE